MNENRFSEKMLMVYSVIVTVFIVGTAWDKTCLWWNCVGQNCTFDTLDEDSDTSNFISELGIINLSNYN